MKTMQAGAKRIMLQTKNVQLGYYLLFTLINYKLDAQHTRNESAEHNLISGIFINIQRGFEPIIQYTCIMSLVR